MRDNESMFRLLFERSADAIFLLDPRRQIFVDCNEAAVQLMRAANKQQLLLMHPADLSPEFQPDGKSSRQKTPEMIEHALAHGTHRFEWLARRFDGTHVPVEVQATPIQTGEHPLIATVCRDITERKTSEKSLLELNSSLEQRVAQRTAELLAANEQLKLAEQASRKRASRAQKHRDVLLELAQLGAPDLERTLERICALAALTLEVDRVSYWSMAENDRAIICEHLHLLGIEGGDKKAKGVRLSCTDYPAYFEALATKRPITADRVLEHPATRDLADSYLKPLGIGSMLDAPVWVRGKVVGVLCHEHIGRPRDWTVEEVDFASSVAGMVSLALEEQQRELSENRLRESEQKFRALFEASSQGIILHDEEKMLEVNPACLRILGFKQASELVGKHPAETSAPIQPGGESANIVARKRIQQCLEEGSARFEWVARNSHGEEVPIEIILTRIQWGGRQLIQAVFNDISERKRAEEELRRSEARLRESESRFSAAFRASPVYITISDFAEGRYVLANEAFLNWTEYRLDEVLGRNSGELDLWADPREREQFWAELRRTGSIHEYECRTRNRKGKVFTMLLSSDLIEINHKPHLLTVGLDITERKRVEMELHRTLAREKELGQLRSSFVSMVSHEFRTPLGIIQSSAEILDDYIDRLDPDERKEHLRSIQKNTRRMASLMEEVLLIGSIEAGKMDFTPSTIELESFLRRLVDEVHSATDRRCPIELTLRNVPPQGLGDERLLRHIFTNLLTNAVKYSEPGSNVDFNVACHGTELVSTIRDCGIGILEADREWLFTAFHRGRNVGDRPGTGLGLVIVKRCVDLHGGKIDVESKPGKGTLVTVRLPKLPDRVKTQPPQSQPALAAPSAVPTLTGKR